MLLRERTPRINEAFKAFVRSKRCTFCDAWPNPLSDPHHLVTRKWREPTRDDFLCVPACRRCHNQIGNLGLTRTLRRHGMTEKDLVLVSVDLVVEFFSGAAARAAAPF